jgi:hypothetical protein
MINSSPFLKKQQVYCFKICSKNLLSDKELINETLQYPVQVLTIHVFENSYEPVQVGKDICRARENSRNVNTNFPQQSVAVFQNYGTSCPSTGSGRNEPTGYFLSDFIRKLPTSPHAN